MEEGEMSHNPATSTHGEQSNPRACHKSSHRSRDKQQVLFRENPKSVLLVSVECPKTSKPNAGAGAAPKPKRAIPSVPYKTSSLPSSIRGAPESWQQLKRPS